MIIWTDAEKAAVVAECARLRQENLMSSLLPLVIEAQAVLPDKRRRHSLSSIQTVGAWFMPLLKAELAKSQKIVEVEVETVLEIPQSLKVVATPELLVELLMRFAGKLDQIDRLLPSGDAPRNGSSVGHELAKARQTIVKPTVVVTGLIRDQPRYLEAKLGHAIAFQFVDHNDDHNTSLPKTADRVYAMTKFIGHSFQQRLRNAYNGQISLHTGSLTSLTEKIAKDLHIPL